MASKKEVSVKRGGKVRIQVSKKGRARARKAAPERRYGPPPALDPARRPPQKPVITVHDMTILFEQINFRERASSAGLDTVDYYLAEVATPDEGAGDWVYWSEMTYGRAPLGFIKRGGTSPRDELEWTEVISQSLLRRQNFNDGGGDTRPDPTHVPNGPVFIFDEIDVHRHTGPSTDVDYRTADTCWPIAKDAAGLGLQLRVGSKQVNLGASAWVEAPQTDKAAESEAIAFPMTNGVNIWGDGKRELYYQPGAFRPPIKGTFQVRLVSSNHFYESFDTADTTNYKVTEGASYGSPEVSGAVPVGKDQTRVFAVPQLWAYEYNNPGPTIPLGPPQTSEPCTLYDFARTIPPHTWLRHWVKPASAIGVIPTAVQKDHARSVHVEILERSGSFPFPPTVIESRSYTDKLDYLSLPIAATGYPYSTGNADHAAIIAHNQSGIGMFYGSQLVHYETPYGARPIVRGDLTVKNTQTPEGRLVGAIKVKDTVKYIWRKTATERDIINLYAGKTTPVRNWISRPDIISGFDLFDIGFPYNEIPTPPVVPTGEKLFKHSLTDQDTVSNPTIPISDW